MRFPSLSDVLLKTIFQNVYLVMMESAWLWPNPTDVGHREQKWALGMKLDRVSSFKPTNAASGTLHDFQTKKRVCLQLVLHVLWHWPIGAQNKNCKQKMMLLEWWNNKVSPWHRSVVTEVMKDGKPIWSGFKVFSSLSSLITVRLWLYCLTWLSDHIERHDIV